MIVMKFLNKLRSQVAAVQGFTQPTVINHKEQLPEGTVGVCTVSGKYITAEDDFVSDRSGRIYLVAALATKKYKEGK